MSYASGTKVSEDRSRTEIEKILLRFGADEFGYMSKKGSAMIGFKCNGLHFEFAVPMPCKDDSKFTLTETGRERSEKQAFDSYMQERRRRWRSLCAVIKAKLIAIEDGVAQFEIEFMPYLVTANGRTVGEQMLPMIQEQQQTGTLLQLSEGGGA